MSDYKAQLYRRSDKKWGWRMIAPNNEIIAGDQGQGYERKAGALNGFRSTMKGFAEILGTQIDGGFLALLGMVIDEVEITVEDDA